MRRTPVTVRFGESCTEEADIAPTTPHFGPVSGVFTSWYARKKTQFNRILANLPPKLQFTEWTGLYSLLQDLKAILPR